MPHDHRETLQDFRYRQARPTEIRGVHESPPRPPLVCTLSLAITAELLRVFFVVFPAFFSFAASDGSDGPIGTFFGFVASTASTVSTVLTASTFFGTDGSVGSVGANDPDGFS
jgi:hypothetical protein